MRRWLPLLAVLLMAPGAQAFASVQQGDSPHDEMTAVAADVGWPEDAVEALQAAVRQPDIDDLEPAPVDGNKDRMDVSVVFRPWHHCDRVPPMSDAEAVKATIAYVDHERSLAQNLSLVDPAAAVRALGRALHALQDCFSHSDIVDLPASAQAALGDALVFGGAPPSSLRLCGSQPGAPDIARPPGDVYPHADFNKDDPNASPEAEALMVDGRSKHEHAFELAANATRVFLTDFMSRLDADETARLLDVDGGHRPRRGMGIPAPGLWVLPGLAMAVAVRRLRA